MTLFFRKQLAVLSEFLASRVKICKWTTQSYFHNTKSHTQLILEHQTDLKRISTDDLNEWHNKKVQSKSIDDCMKNKNIVWLSNSSCKKVQERESAKNYLSFYRYCHVNIFICTQDYCSFIFWKDYK